MSIAGHLPLRPTHSPVPRSWERCSDPSPPRRSDDAEDPRQWAPIDARDQGDGPDSEGTDDGDDGDDAPISHAAVREMMVRFRRNAFAPVHAVGSAPGSTLECHPCHPCLAAHPTAVRPPRSPPRAGHRGAAPAMDRTHDDARCEEHAARIRDGVDAFTQMANDLLAAHQTSVLVTRIDTRTPHSEETTVHARLARPAHASGSDDRELLDWLRAAIDLSHPVLCASIVPSSLDGIDEVVVQLPSRKTLLGRAWNTVPALRRLRSQQVRIVIQGLVAIALVLLVAAIVQSDWLRTLGDAPDAPMHDEP